MIHYPHDTDKTDDWVANLCLLVLIGILLFIFS